MFCTNDGNGDPWNSNDDDNGPARRTIFVRNLPINIKHAEIIDVFSTVGLIEVSLNHVNLIRFS
jgi:RNA recognition motif-containing protein